MTKKCKRCGICCNTMVTEINPKDIRALSMRENFVKIITLHGDTFAVMRSDCVKYSNKRCIINDRKPESCKVFPTKDYEEKWRLINPECGMLD